MSTPVHPVPALRLLGTRGGREGGWGGEGLEGPAWSFLAADFYFSFFKYVILHPPPPPHPPPHFPPLTFFLLPVSSSYLQFQSAHIWCSTNSMKLSAENHNTFAVINEMPKFCTFSSTTSLSRRTDWKQESYSEDFFLPPCDCLHSCPWRFTHFTAHMPSGSIFEIEQIQITFIKQTGLLKCMFLHNLTCDAVVPLWKRKHSLWDKCLPSRV